MLAMSLLTFYFFMRKHIHYFLFIVLLCLFWGCYEGVLQHVIYYQEQHHLFLFSCEYFHQTILSEGWTGYLGNFLVQFFYYPRWGSLLLAGMIASLYLLVYKLFYWVTGRLDCMQVSLIPSLYFFLKVMKPDYQLGELVVVWLVMLVLAVGAWLFADRLRNLTDRWPVWVMKPYVFWLIASVGIGSVGFISFLRFVDNYNMGEYRMIMADKAVKERKWDEVLEQTELYLNSGRNNQLMFYFRNLAWYHQGELLNHLLDYSNKYGVQSLYFPWNGDSRESEYGHYIYEDLGYINEANRWVFESMVVWGEVAPHLIDLAKYNILIDRPAVAQCFINRLKQSAFYGKQALELEQYLQEGKVPGLYLALPNHVEGKPRFANILNIGPELYYLCEQSGNNNMAFEYLIADLLLSNQVVRLVQVLKDFPLYTQRLGHFPPILEEALYIYKLGVGEEKFQESGLSISSRVEDCFRRYYSLYQQKDYKTLYAEFGQSYWYYLHFLSPYGTKIITD